MESHPTQPGRLDAWQKVTMVQVTAIQVSTGPRREDQLESLGLPFFVELPFRDGWKSSAIPQFH